MILCFQPLSLLVIILSIDLLVLVSLSVFMVISPMASLTLWQFYLILIFFSQLNLLLEHILDLYDEVMRKLGINIANYKLANDVHRRDKDFNVSDYVMFESVQSIILNIRLRNYMLMPLTHSLLFKSLVLMHIY